MPENSLTPMYEQPSAIAVADVDPPTTGTQPVHLAASLPCPIHGMPNLCASTKPAAFLLPDRAKGDKVLDEMSRS